MKLKMTSYILFIAIFFSLFFCLPVAIQADTCPNYIRAASIKASHATAIAVDSSGNLYIAEMNKNQILIYNSSGRYSKRLSGAYSMCMRIKPFMPKLASLQLCSPQMYVWTGTGSTPMPAVLWPRKQNKRLMLGSFS